MTPSGDGNVDETREAEIKIVKTEMNEKEIPLLSKKIETESTEG